MFPQSRHPVSTAPGGTGSACGGHFPPRGAGSGGEESDRSAAGVGGRKGLGPGSRQEWGGRRDGPSLRSAPSARSDCAFLSRSVRTRRRTRLRGSPSNSPSRSRWTASRRSSSSSRLSTTGEPRWGRAGGPLRSAPPPLGAGLQRAAASRRWRAEPGRRGALGRERGWRRPGPW